MQTITWKNKHHSILRIPRCKPWWISAEDTDRGHKTQMMHKKRNRDHNFKDQGAASFRSTEHRDAYRNVEERASFHPEGRYRDAYRSIKKKKHHFNLRVPRCKPWWISPEGTGRGRKTQMMHKREFVIIILRIKEEHHFVQQNTGMHTVTYKNKHHSTLRVPRCIPEHKQKKHHFTLRVPRCKPWWNTISIEWK